MNLTPNSFSDPNKLSSSEAFSSQFKHNLNYFDIIDLGAESTAPFNDAISSKNELERFESVFFPYVYNNPDPEITISIDSYKPEVFYELALFLREQWPKTKLIYNDVSGKVDIELKSLLAESLEFEYILCHNLAPSRDKSSEHMNYLAEDIGSSVQDFFYQHSSLADKRVVHADPCFGFSKSYGQNHELLRSIHSLDCFDGYSSIVLGLSRKSFLRSPSELSPKRADDLKVIEQVHASLLFSSILECKKNLIVRTHDISPLYSALVAGEML